MESPPQLAVVICTYNRSDSLIRTLNSLYTDGYADSTSIDILVITNNCTDDTIKRLTTFRATHPQDLLRLQWLEESRPGKSYALNTAIENTAHQILCFIDDDQVVEKGFLEHLQAGINSYPEDSIYCGRIWPKWDGSEPSWVHAKEPYAIPIRPFPEFDLGQTSVEINPTDRYPSGGNISVRRNVFEKVGNFSTELGPTGHNLAGGEDHDFLRRTIKKKFTVRYLPKVRQLHAIDPVRTSTIYTLRKSFFRSLSSVLIHPVKTKPQPYMFRKVLTHLWNATFTLNSDRRFFYFVRLAASLGELVGAFDSIRISKSRPKRSLSLPAEKRMAIGVATVIITCFCVAIISLLSKFQLYLIVQRFLPALIIALLGTGILLIKSVQDFSQTGPRIQKEVLHHYKWYSIFALSRLSIWAFGLMLLIGGAGVVIYDALVLIIGLTYSPWLAAAFAALAIVTATAMQFCHKLLWNPGLLIASMHYRASRFYSLWDKLNPSRLRKLFLLAIGIISAILLTASLELITLKQPNLLIALWSASFFYIGLFFWSRHLPSTTSQTNQPKTGQPNIIMIGSDTLRADSLGKGLTPNIDKLSSRGSRFTQCYVPCARTAPSLVSMMTGTWPQTHGIRDNFVADDETNLSISALPEWLSKQGYVSAAISDWCGADIGKFDFGFDYFDLPEDQWNLKYFIRQGPKDLRLFLSLFTHNRLGRKFLPEIYYLGGVPLTSQLGKRARHLVSQLAQAQQPFFFNAFYSTTHPPFASEYPWYTQHSSPGYKGESKFAMARLTEPFDIIRRQGEPKEEFDLDQILSLYDGCVAQFDHEVGCMLEQLESSGLADNTIVVIYSDHGMEFFEHDTWGQGNSAIGEASPRIPLIIYDPRRNPTAQIEQIVRSIDIAPTLADLVGAAIPTEVDGVSLVPILDDPNQKLDLCAFNETGLWLTDIPGLPKDHLRYPDLLELLTVPDLTTGTLAIKDEYVPRILAAKDMMVRKEKWKLVYQPLETDCQLLLFNMDTDPQCKQNCAREHPEIVQSLRDELDTWAQRKVKT